MCSGSVAGSFSRHTDLTIGSRVSKKRGKFRVWDLGFRRENLMRVMAWLAKGSGDAASPRAYIYIYINIYKYTYTHI
jgi:hypothetical protein